MLEKGIEFLFNREKYKDLKMFLQVIIYFPVLVIVPMILPHRQVQIICFVLFIWVFVHTSIKISLYDKKKLKPPRKSNWALLIVSALCALSSPFGFFITEGFLS